MEDNDSVYEAIVSKKRERDDIIDNAMHNTIKLITPENIKAFFSKVKQEIMNQCHDPSHIIFEFEICDFDSPFMESDLTIFKPLIDAVWNTMNALNLLRIEDSKEFYTKFTHALQDYLEILIDAWNQKHHRTQIRSDFCKEDYVVYLKKK